METQSLNNKRIAKNTLLLYFRTIFVMLISLYTSRVILNALGVNNYGIYNVVGGVVAMFSLISGSLSSSISRFITFELGKGNVEKLKLVFTTSINIQIGFSIIILLLGEIIGGWFLNTHMNIPADRINAANWTLHCSLLMFCINLISIPYNACIIAYERMTAFAYVSILEASLKLIICYLIVMSPYDKLISYAILLVFVSLIIRSVYGLYCRHNFEECRYQWTKDTSLVKEMTGFAGWSFLANSAYMLSTQGINMLINVFFGVAINAARGIAVQVEGTVNQFVNNFMTALNPQITKSYANGDVSYMAILVCRGAKYSFYIMLVFFIPFELESYAILRFWLGLVPEGTVTFLRLVLLATMITLIGNPLYTAILATGNIRRYQLVGTCCTILIFPLSWEAYKLGFHAYVAYIIYSFIYIAIIGIRLIELKRLIKFPVMLYVNEVLRNVLLVCACASIVPLYLHWIFKNENFEFILICVDVMWTIIICFLLGLNKKEKEFLIQKVMTVKRNIIKLLNLD